MVAATAYFQYVRDDHEDPHQGARTARVRGGPGLSGRDAVARPLTEHGQRRLREDIAEAYERLREQPDEWAAYNAELDEWDSVTADGADDRR